MHQSVKSDGIQFPSRQLQSTQPSMFDDLTRPFKELDADELGVRFASRNSGVRHGIMDSDETFERHRKPPEVLIFCNDPRARGHACRRLKWSRAYYSMDMAGVGDRSTPD